MLPMGLKGMPAQSRLGDLGLTTSALSVGAAGLYAACGEQRHLSHAACSTLRVARCTLRVARCTLRVARCVLHGARCVLHVARCVLHVARCVLHVARCVLHGACRMLHAARWQVLLQLVAHASAARLVFGSALIHPQASIPLMPFVPTIGSARHSDFSREQ